jgi:methylated-DNA-[protein]-cysteine S-methyltransferase
MSTIRSTSLPVVTYTHIDSLLGQLLLTSCEGKLSGLYFADRPHACLAPTWVREDNAVIFALIERQLEDYAAGERTSFDLAQIGLTGTPFQMMVWQEIARIPFGQTITYGELAQRLGRSAADARAVGTATGHNPVSWIIPCHRVVGKSGAITGYAGGIARKRALLNFEAARSAGREAVLTFGEEEPTLELV